MKKVCIAIVLQVTQLDGIALWMKALSKGDFAICELLNGLIDAKIVLRTR